MIKKLTSAFIIFMFCCGMAYADTQKQKPYKPPSERQYMELQTIFTNFSDKDIEKSIKLARKAENVELINNILEFLLYKKLILQTKKLPPIFLIYSEDNSVLDYKGGVYYDNENIILLNANLLMENSPQHKEIPKNVKAAIDFAVFSSILSHELMHYEDYLGAQNADAFTLSEWKAYKRSEKSIDYFLKMNKAEADEIIPIAGFYNTIQQAKDYFANMRKNYVRTIQAADIFLNNENKICETFGIDRNMFKMIAFFPQSQFNAKNEGHIVRTESNLLDFPQKLKFEINILTGAVTILNSPHAIEEIKRQAQNIKFIDKKFYRIMR